MALAAAFQFKRRSSDYSIWRFFLYFFLLLILLFFLSLLLLQHTEYTECAVLMSVSVPLDVLNRISLLPSFFSPLLLSLFLNLFRLWVLFHFCLCSHHEKKTQRPTTNHSQKPHTAHLLNRLPGIFSLLLLLPFNIFFFLSAVHINRLYQTDPYHHWCNANCKWSDLKPACIQPNKSETNETTTTRRGRRKRSDADDKFSSSRRAIFFRAVHAKRYCEFKTKQNKNSTINSATAIRIKRISVATKLWKTF